MDSTSKVDLVWSPDHRVACRKEGWFINLTDDICAVRHHVMNSDRIDRFKTDEDARDFVIVRAIAGDPLCREAIALLMTKRLKGETA